MIFLRGGSLTPTPITNRVKVLVNFITNIALKQHFAFPIIWALNSRIIFSFFYVFQCSNTNLVCISETLFMHFMIIEEKVKSENSNKNFAIKTKFYSVKMSKVKGLKLGCIVAWLFIRNQVHDYECSLIYYSPIIPKFAEFQFKFLT